ncbi:MAG: hypothetical protein H7A23_19635 [Leptospiraceae bacterium]|nr:hypothetical protein [Leptospiraceae bacterium]MCP5496768.1 hypothetical protein [Leptospiraceae bacterium]
MKNCIWFILLLFIHCSAKTINIGHNQKKFGLRYSYRVGVLPYKDSRTNEMPKLVEYQNVLQDFKKVLNDQPIKVNYSCNTNSNRFFSVEYLAQDLKQAEVFQDIIELSGFPELDTSELIQRYQLDLLIQPELKDIYLEKSFSIANLFGYMLPPAVLMGLIGIPFPLLVEYNFVIYLDINFYKKNNSKMIKKNYIHKGIRFADIGTSYYEFDTENKKHNLGLLIKNLYENLEYEISEEMFTEL